MTHSCPDVRVNVLGVGISPVSLREASERVVALATSHRGGYVCVTGVHGVMESHDDDALRAVHNHADLVVPDGMPMVWLSKLRGHPDVTRVYGPDLMLEVARRTAGSEVTHFLYGGAPGVAEKLAARLVARFPGLTIAGSYCPPFRALTDEETTAIVGAIDASAATIVWVGLSTPKQERWMHEFAPRLPGRVLLGVGAAFDFHAGLKPQAPSWMQRSGLEWLFRLITEPRRLWRRYLRNNPRFIGLTLLQLTGLRPYAFDTAFSAGTDASVPESPTT